MRAVWAAGLSAVIVLPLAAAGMSQAASGSATAAGTATARVGQAAVDAQAAKKKSKKAKVKKVTLKSSRKSVHVDGTVRLKGKVKAKPKGRFHVAFEEKYPGSKKWRGAGAKVSKKKSGAASLRVGLNKTGTYKFRLVTKKKKSKVISVKATKPRPPVPPVPPVPPKSISVDWPQGSDLEVDRQYSVPVAVKPAGNVQVRLQALDGSGWSDLYGGAANTGDDGKVQVILSVPDAGAVQLRANVVGIPLNSDPVRKNFTDGGDTLYNIPMNLPDKRGVLVKAQEFPMTYPKVLLPNPLGSGSLILPQIGTPAAGPPTCVTDPAIPRADCKIPGKQYRFMYTTERWYPDTDGGGAVQGGSQGATGLIMVPPNVQKDAPVVAWAHPTIGQANQCSISRGVDTIMVPGNPNPQPGGMDINLIDAVFFLDQMLQAGYIVVMPDYLGIAVNGPTSNQKTYVVGPQEARDVFFAVDALQTGAKKGKGWPGLPEAGNDFVVMGHSQGGHAALWTGILADELGPKTGQNLEGVVTVAPASDLNKLVDVQWNQQLNWVLGPEVIQTWLGYLGGWAFQNNTITDAAIENLDRYESYCTTQAIAASTEFFPNGPDQPGTAFMRNPDLPANQQAFYNWSRIFSKMTPDIAQGRSNSFPKDLPVQFVSGTADQVVLSQANAAMQEAFCSAGANMTAYWTPVLTGAVNTNPPKTDAVQAADHLNVLAFPWANTVGSDPQLAGGALQEFAADRFAGKNLKPDCADRQAAHNFVAPNQFTKQSWYIFPRLTWSGTTPSLDLTKANTYETGGSPSLPAPASPAGQGVNPAPALGTVDVQSGAQTGCGWQFTYLGLSKIGFPQYESNANCYQWGMYPYDELIYDDAKVGKTWGSYPYSPPKP